MHAAYWLIVNVFNRSKPVQLPLSYPDPNAEFYGYDRRTVRLMDGTEAPSTRNLIRVTGWAATALVAYQAHEYVVRTRECRTAYRQFLNDEWAALIEQIYEKCRLEWHYRVPDTMTDRHELRSICERTLGFENHFLHAYTQFVIAELDSGNMTAQAEVLRFLTNTALHDQDVIRRIRHLTNSVDIGIRRDAKAALEQFSSENT